MVDGRLAFKSKARENDAVRVKQLIWQRTSLSVRVGAHKKNGSTLGVVHVLVCDLGDCLSINTLPTIHGTAERVSEFLFLSRTFDLQQLYKYCTTTWHVYYLNCKIDGEKLFRENTRVDFCLTEMVDKNVITILRNWIEIGSTTNGYDCFLKTYIFFNYKTFSKMYKKKIQYSKLGQNNFTVLTLIVKNDFYFQILVYHCRFNCVHTATMYSRN